MTEIEDPFWIFRGYLHTVNRTYIVYQHRVTFEIKYV